MDERVSLITLIFSDGNEVKTIRNLSGHDAQVFIDIINEVSLCTLSPPFTQTSTPCRLGTGWAHTADPQEVCADYIHYLWPPSPASEITVDSTLL